jgi:hypothetical protein
MPDFGEELDDYGPDPEQCQGPSEGHTPAIHYASPLLRNMLNTVAEPTRKSGSLDGDLERIRKAEEKRERRAAARSQGTRHGF